MTAGFYGSESVPKMVSIRSETVWGPVFGRVAQKYEGFSQMCKMYMVSLVQSIECAAGTAVGKVAHQTHGEGLQHEE